MSPFLQSWWKEEEEASLEHAQCVCGHVIGRNSQEAGEPLNRTRKEWPRSNVKNTITFKLYKVSIPCNQWETHQTPGNNTCVILCVDERRGASPQQCQHGDAWHGDNGVLLRLYNTLRIISYLGALSFANKGPCQTIMALILETRLIESGNVRPKHNAPNLVILICQYAIYTIVGCKINQNIQTVIVKLCLKLYTLIITSAYRCIWEHVGETWPL